MSVCLTNIRTYILQDAFYVEWACIISLVYERHCLMKYMTVFFSSNNFQKYSRAPDVHVNCNDP